MVLGKIGIPGGRASGSGGLPPSLAVSCDRTICGEGHPDTVGVTSDNGYFYIQTDNDGALFFRRCNEWVQIA